MHAPRWPTSRFKAKGRECHPLAGSSKRTQNRADRWVAVWLPPQVTTRGAPDAMGTANSMVQGATSIANSSGAPSKWEIPRDSHCAADHNEMGN